MLIRVGTEPNIQNWRDARRIELLAARIAVPMPQRRQWNHLVTQQLATYFPMLQSMVVGGYWPFRGEFDPRLLMRQLRDSGSRLALPVVVRKNTPLQFLEWWPGAPTVKAALSLPVPDGTEVLAPQVLLIPPVGFDAHGYRLGYGGGYFDRTLAEMRPQPLKIGVGFEISRLPTIHPQAHDVAMDFIVTEAGVYSVGEAGLTLLNAAPVPPKAAATASAGAVTSALHALN
jgi:5-formyltetrahydrofolate cyclo-ligase